MNLKDIFWLSYKDLREKKIRTALTVIMVVIGVASIIALTSQTQGISQSIQTSLESLGPTSIILTSSSSTGFTVADTARLSTLPNVSSVIPILTGSVNVYANSQNVSATLIGISSEGLQSLLGVINLYQGSIFQDTIAPSAVIGYSIAFPTALAGKQNIIVGQPATIKLSGKGGETLTLPIIGILQRYGTSVIPIDTGVIVSMQAAEVLLHKDSFNIILVKANNVSSVNELSLLITTVYGSSARVLTTQQLLETTSSIIGSITILFVIIAGISLVVAAIGIMNIMLIAVYERTHEIGILKALGFKNRHILTVFLFQALLIGIIGGIIGILVGAGASYSLSAIISGAQASTNSNTRNSGSGVFVAGSARSGSFSGGGATFAAGASPATSSGAGLSSLSYSPVFTPITILEAILVAVIVSVVAGVYPAIRASKMEPIEALREL